MEAVRALLENLEIDPKDDFEPHARKLKDQSQTVVEERGYVSGKKDLSEILTTFESRIREILDDPLHIYSGTGIHQIGLSTGPRIGQENVMKALFLSDLPTVCTGQWLSTLREEDEHTPDGTFIYYRTLEINTDFVRDLHENWPAIENGALVILPESPKVDDVSDTEPSLGELRSTKVVDIGVKPELYNLVVDSYERKRQVVVLPELHVPWIRGTKLDEILKVRQESTEELSRFQRAYHDSMLEYMKRYGKVDFGKMSVEIHKGEVQPALDKLNDRYKRFLSHRRKHESIGILSVVPISVAIVSATIFDQTLGDIPSMIAPTTAAVLSALARYRVDKKDGLASLEEDKYYVVWKVGRS